MTAKLVIGLAVALSLPGPARSTPAGDYAFIAAYRELIIVTQEFDRCSRFGSHPGAPIATIEEEDRMRTEISTRVDRIRKTLRQMPWSDLRDRAWLAFDNAPGALFHCETLMGSYSRTSDIAGRVERILKDLQADRSRR